MPWQPWIVQFTQFFSTVKAFAPVTWSWRSPVQKEMNVVCSKSLSQFYLPFMSPSSTIQTHSSELAAFPLCVCGYSCHVDAKYLHVSALQLQVQTHSIFLLQSCNTDAWIKMCCFFCLSDCFFFRVTTDMPPALEWTTIGAREQRLWVPAMTV